MTGGPMIQFRAMLGLALLLFMPACSGGSSNEPAQPDARQIDSAEIERLRALGYVGVGPALPPEAAAGVLTHVEARAADGVNFFVNAHFCTAQLMDMRGQILHSWSREPCFRWGNAVLAPNGDLIVMGRLPHAATPQAAREARYLERMDWNGESLWRRGMTAHHDVDLAPDGRLLTLDYELRIVPEIDEQTPVRENSIVVLDRAGAILERVSLTELLTSAPDLFTLQPGRARRFEGAPEIDTLHSNSIEWIRQPALVGTQPIYSEDSILICIRNQDTLAIVDWSEKRLIWAWGQGQLSGPHDATLLPNGNILAFDNGLGRNWSRVVEVDPLERKIVWEWRAEDPQSFYSRTRGANQRLTNGNTLIVESDNGRAFEVTADGEIVWEFLNPNMTEKREPSVIVRMRRFEGTSYADLEARIARGENLPFRID